MTTLPISRYTGANTFSAQDYAGNIFYAYQSSSGDTGVLVMVNPAGTPTVITPAVVGGRPSFECNPSVGLWLVGNKETGSTRPPPRYPIKEYVPWPVGVGPQGPQGPQGVPGAPGVGGVALFPAPYVSAAWSGRQMSGGTVIDIPTTFGCPCARAYLVGLSGLATTAGVIVRAGSEIAPYFLTLVTQAPNVRMDCQGWIPGPVALVSVVGSAQTWLQVIAGF
jgi:hypothetical protein